MKQLNDLINKEEPGWDIVQEWLKNAINHYEILPKNTQRSEKELVKSQISTRSLMGAVIYETGGILVNFGWIRILGSGSSKLDRGLMEWNQGKTIKNIGDHPPFLLVADDIIGGYFAINAGGLGPEIGNIYYLQQDSLEWENLDCGYSDFLNWVLNGDIQKFYAPFKWQNWEKDVANIGGNQTFSFFPFLWTEYENFEQISRKLVPAEEHYYFTLEMQKQFFS